MPKHVLKPLLLALPLVLGAVLAAPSAQAVYPTVAYDPVPGGIFLFGACQTAVAGARDPATFDWMLTVVLEGVCPFGTAWTETCTAPFWQDVGSGFTAFCPSGATLTTGGTATWPSTPSLVTAWTWWEYGFCPNPQPLCVSSWGQAHWTV